MVNMKRRARLVLGLMVVLFLGTSSSARALDRLCDPSHEDCRAVLINYIRAEKVGIDVGFWFMEDARYSYELVKRFQAGVPVRLISEVPPKDATPGISDRRTYVT